MKDALTSTRNKVAQLNMLLIEALQEKQDLRNQYTQMQENNDESFRRITETVAAARDEIRASCAPEIADKLCAKFDEVFGPHSGAQNVEQNPVA